MSPTGRALAAATLAATAGCAGSLSQPVAQPPAIVQRPAQTATGVEGPAPAPTAALAGTVVAAGDRKPLARARVTIASPALAEPRAFDPAFAGVGDETGPLTFTATYYPGTPRIEQAARVTVVGGVEPQLKVVFPLRIVRPARVSGILTTPDKRPLISGAVVMSPIPGDGLVAVPPRDVVILPDGTFAFRNVPPGRYEIRARGEVEPQGTARFAAFSLTVDGRDVAGLTMTLLPGASVAGTLDVDAVAIPRPVTVRGVRIRAPFADGSSFGDSLTGDVGPDGAFRIRGLMDGAHYLRVEGLQPPWVLKEVVHRGQDVTDIPLRVASGHEYTDVRITITNATTDVAGTAIDAGRPAPAALIVVIPASQQFWSRTSHRFGLLRADANGRYQIRGLPAGEYRAAATYDVDESEVMRRDVLQDLFASATSLSLAARERRALDLPLVSLASGRRTDAR